MPNTYGYDEASRKLKGLTVEMVEQNIALFNSGSGGTLVLAGLSGEGDFKINKFVKDIMDTAGYRRDPSSTAGITHADYLEGEEVAVKIAGGWAVKVPDAVLMWQGGEATREVKEALVALATQYADYIVRDQINSLITSMANAFPTEATTTSDLSAGNEVIDQLQINTLLNKFGDKEGKIVALIMHSGANTGLKADGISNSNSLDTVGGVIINTGAVTAQGRRIIVTDCPALAYHDGTRNVYKVLALTANAGVASNITETSDIQRVQGKQNLTTIFQANNQWDQAIKGWSWDSTIPYPTDAELATGANWTMLTGVKNTAGLCLITPQVEV